MHICLHTHVCLYIDPHPYLHTEVHKYVYMYVYVCVIPISSTTAELKRTDMRYL